MAAKVIDFCMGRPANAGVDGFAEGFGLYAINKFLRRFT